VVLTGVPTRPTLSRRRFVKVRSPRKEHLTWRTWPVQRRLAHRCRGIDEFIDADTERPGQAKRPIEVIEDP